MKRLLVKYSVLYLAFAFVLSASVLAVGSLWTRTVVRAQYASVARPTIDFLAGGMLSERVNRQRINGLLRALARHPDIVMSAVVHGKAQMVFARGVQKRDQVLWPLHVSYPLFKGKEIIGWLRIWPSPESLVRTFLYSHLRYVVLLVLVVWFVCLFLPLLFFFRRFAFEPLTHFRSFIDAMAQDTPPHDPQLRHREWRDMYEKLRGLHTRIGDTNDTLQLLFAVSQMLTSHLDVTEIFNIIMETTQKKYPGVLAAIFLQREDGFLCVRAHRGFSSEFVRHMHIKPGEGMGGLAFQKCQPMTVNDIAHNPQIHNRHMVEAEGIASFVHLPLIVDGKCAGILNIASRQRDFFDQEKQQMFAMVAKYISIVIRNAQLYERIQELNRRLETEVSSTTQELVQTNSRLIQKVREMRALSDIAALSSAKISLPDIMHLMVEKIQDLLSVQTAGIFLFHEESRRLVPAAPFFGIRERDFSSLHVDPDASPVLAAALFDGKQYLCNSAAEAAQAVPVLQNIVVMQSLLVMSLRSGKKGIGVLCLANRLSGSFSTDDLRIAELIADRISVIIENAALYARLEGHVHELTTLQEISSAISSEPVRDQILSAIVKAATKAFSADICFLALFDERTKMLTVQPGAHFIDGDEKVAIAVSTQDSQSLMAQVYRAGDQFSSPDALIDPRVKSPYVRSWDIRSLVLTPLRAENKVIGLLLFGRRQANAYGRDQERLASLIAHQAAIIIENAHLYAHLREAKSELEQLNQIKNEFISMVSHELRTPITAIKGFVKVVLGREAGDINAQQEKFLQIADRSIDRLTMLISDLLDISRIESGQFSLHLAPVPPADVVREVIRGVTADADRRSLTITSTVADAFPQVMADRGRLIQVFDNLIMNALKFTPDGGAITVSAQDKGDFALFSVRDTGIGIAKKDHQKIFEKFFQAQSGTRRTAPGTGLGLAIVKSIIEMHGGEIWVESEPGKGSTFQFIIPRAKTEISADVNV